MPNYIRPVQNGACVFLTVTLADRRSQLLLHEVEALRDAIRQTQRNWPFKVNAFVVLPNHFHAVITLPAEDAAYSTRVRVIKSRFSRKFARQNLRQSHIKRSERGIWQRRFWEHHIRGPDDYAAHVRYCWNNPVKHGLVERPSDWPYSSIHRDTQRGLVPPEWTDQFARTP
ncbi:REP-associated tyrosine transposase [Roseobacter sp. N2S]|uniref:REP-associated tyrosine transposase n=1 Tax=Roseobacter sp. N2S TaxID=2663844 RepID=UPI00285450C2|nr:transposase [Roseobacter sp. N2S]MDR6266304.1 putative transposase [Roseobacter sp. N2S]